MHIHSSFDLSAASGLLLPPLLRERERETAVARNWVRLSPFVALGEGGIRQSFSSRVCKKMPSTHTLKEKHRFSLTIFYYDVWVMSVGGVWVFLGVHTRL